VGAPDEAAHARDARAKVAAIEAADALLLAPLAAALRGRARSHDRGAATLRVCADHGCDPATGEHDGAPVPCVLWSDAADALDTARERRMTERAVAGLAIAELPAGGLWPVERDARARRAVAA